MASADDVENREWVSAYFITLTAITLAFCLVRVASRLHRTAASFGIDDAFIALSWTTSAAMTALTIVGNMRYGFDRHQSNVAPDSITNAIEFTWILNILYLAQTAFAKISILLFYRRLVQSVYSPRFKNAIWIVIIVVAVYSFVIFILYVTECIPVDAIWLLFDPRWAVANQHSCSSQAQDIGTAWTSGLMAVITDFLAVLLPSWVFVWITLSHRARIALSVIFALGFLTIIPSVFRLIYLVRAAQPNADKTWYALNALVSGKTEGDFGIICACAPCFHVFFQRFFQDRGRNREASVRPGSHAASREPNRRRPSVRSYRSATSDRSVRTVRFDQTTLAACQTLRPEPDAPQVLMWSDKSMDNIPEAYAEDVGRERAVEDIESALSEDYGTKSSFPRPGTTQSWLNLDTDSSDEERDLTGMWYPDKALKSYPHR